MKTAYDEIAGAWANKIVTPIRMGLALYSDETDVEIVTALSCCHEATDLLEAAIQRLVMAAAKKGQPK